MITTYSELKTAVANWLWERSDLTDRIPEFIANGEARLNRKVRHREMESSDSVTVDAAGEATLPSGYAERRLLKLDTDPATWPEYVEPGAREFLYRHRPYGLPQYYTIVEGKLLVKPAQATTGTFWFYKRIPALTDAAPTNWLLTLAPDAYLHAALIEGAIYLEDEEMMRTHVAMFEEAMNELMDADRRRRAHQTPVQPHPLAQKTEETL